MKLRLNMAETRDNRMESLSSSSNAHQKSTVKIKQVAFPDSATSWGRQSQGLRGGSSARVEPMLSNNAPNADSQYFRVPHVQPTPKAATRCGLRSHQKSLAPVNAGSLSADAITGEIITPSSMDPMSLMGGSASARAAVSVSVQRDVRAPERYITGNKYVPTVETAQTLRVEKPSAMKAAQRQQMEYQNYQRSLATGDITVSRPTTNGGSAIGASLDAGSLAPPAPQYAAAERLEQQSWQVQGQDSDSFSQLSENQSQVSLLSTLSSQPMFAAASYTAAGLGSLRPPPQTHTQSLHLANSSKEKATVLFGQEILRVSSLADQRARSSRLGATLNASQANYASNHAGTDAASVGSIGSLGSDGSRSRTGSERSRVLPNSKTGTGMLLQRNPVPKTAPSDGPDSEEDDGGDDDVSLSTIESVYSAYEDARSAVQQELAHKSAAMMGHRSGGAGILVRRPKPAASRMQVEYGTVQNRSLEVDAEEVARLADSVPLLATLQKTSKLGVRSDSYASRKVRQKKSKRSRGQHTCRVVDSRQGAYKLTLDTERLRGADEAGGGDEQHRNFPQGCDIGDGGEVSDVWVHSPIAAVADAPWIRDKKPGNIHVPTSLCKMLSGDPVLPRPGDAVLNPRSVESLNWRDSQRKSSVDFDDDDDDDLSVNSASSAGTRGKMEEARLKQLSASPGSSNGCRVKCVNPVDWQNKKMMREFGVADTARVFKNSKKQQELVRPALERFSEECQNNTLRSPGSADEDLGAFPLSPQPDLNMRSKEGDDEHSDTFDDSNLGDSNSIGGNANSLELQKACSDALFAPPTRSHSVMTDQCDSPSMPLSSRRSASKSHAAEF